MPRGGGIERALCVAAAVVAVAGCAGEANTGPGAIAGDVTLAPAEFTLLSGGRAAGPLAFPAGGPAGAQYLVVGQLATGVADLALRYTLAGSAPESASARIEAAPPAGPRSRPYALRFHDALRRFDDAVARASLSMPRAAARSAVPPRVVPPVPGSQKSFKVCGNIACSFTVTVVATAQVVGAHSAIYLDNAAPAGGFQAADLRRIGAQFDSVLYPIDTLAFGAPSDIDNNGVVMILLTPAVNALTPQSECLTSYVTGFFLGADLAPATRASYNDGEVFYGLVPDPQGTVSCTFTVTDVEQKIAPTFIHEFQHMIAFNQHVLQRGGPTEDLWLGEGLSHLAEELGGRHYDSTGDSTTASAFYLGDLDNAFQYLVTPAANPMVTLTPPGGLEERGAEWLFVRYLADQFGPQTTRLLEATSLRGDANVAAVTGVPFATLLGRWALALYVSDLPGFTPDSALTYRSWGFRAAFASLHASDPVDFYRPFPLIPATAAAGAFSLAGTVTSGSGTYLVVTLPPGGGAFSLTFTAAGGGLLPASADPQLAIVRLF